MNILWSDCKIKLTSKWFDYVTYYSLPAKLDSCWKTLPFFCICERKSISLLPLWNNTAFSHVYKSKSMHSHEYFYIQFNFWCLIKMNPTFPHSFLWAALKLRPDCCSWNSQYILQKHKGSSRGQNNHQILMVCLAAGAKYLDREVAATEVCADALCDLAIEVAPPSNSFFLQFVANFLRMSRIHIW